MLRNYVIVTASYWGFTLVDGALRMLVLLHFFRLGYTPFTLAFLFLLYEMAGIAANLGGGWLASRFGIPRMLATGQILQIAGLIMLSMLDPGWSAAASVVWVVIAQGIAGIAKDVTKTASKSAIKATSVEGSGQLFRWVAWFTGSKNAMKGIGFFVGGLLLEVAGFRQALWLMAGLLGVILIAGLVSLPTQLGKAKSSKIHPRALFEVARRQSSGGSAHLHVRRARCLVRGRLAGVSLRQWLALSRSRRVSRALDHRLWRRSGLGAVARDAQRRRFVPRGSGGPALGRAACCGSHCAGSSHANARARVGPTWSSS